MPPARRGVRPQRQSQAKRSTKENPLAMEESQVSIEIEDITTWNPSVNILIHGQPGVGKTALAGGAPNAVFLSTEHEGPVSAKRAGSKADLIRALDWEHAAAGVKWAENNMGEDDWLIVDSGTKMQELYMRWILRTIKASNPGRDLDIPAIQDHQKYQNGFKRWYDRIIDGKFNSIFITNSMVVDDAEGETHVVPLILGKKGEISSYISAQAGIALYYDVARESKEGESPSVIRRALAQPYPPWFAKDRYTALGSYWDVEDGYYWAMSDMVEAVYKAREEIISAS